LLILCSSLLLSAKKRPANQSAATQEINGLPNVSTKRNPDSNEVSISADLLFWVVHEAGPDCWAEVFDTNPGSVVNEIRQVEFQWDPGFIVGVGYGMAYDQWNTNASYTWFHTEGKDFASSDQGAIFSTFLGNFYADNPDGAGLHGPSYRRAYIDWTVSFNMFDWELGRSFRVSEALSLRPFVAAKGGWIHQSVHTRWEIPDVAALPNPVPFNQASENIKNHFWGIGPAAGVDTRWNLFAKDWGVYLFGNFSGALLWGHWSFDDLYENDIPHQVKVDSQSLDGGAPMVRAFMGLGWNRYFNQSGLLFSAKLGYELQFWLGQLKFYSFTAGRQESLLTLQGGTFAFGLDY
jgi:hypothetical protein